ncbi:MAG: hypothetical protein NE334_18280 [Lentisphaeraceae bacterium]|nr:hypothetical protein [Lentisphaeraceae bacterium]
MNQLKQLSAAIIFSIILSSCSLYKSTPKHYTLDEVIQLTETKGIHAIIHGADHERKLYVISWSSPENFFNRYNLVISPTSSSIYQQFSTLNRGDRVLIKGKVNKNRGQAHIEVSQLTKTKKYDPKIEHTAGQYFPKTQLPGKLLEQSSETFYLHATDESGSVLVLEYGDTIVPMIVKNPELSKDLYRGDYVKLSYKIHTSEDKRRPTHLYLDSSAETPVEVLDPVVKLHDQELTLKGRLVMFPKSPTINRNIFAVEVHWDKMKNQAPRYFTILPKDFTSENFKNMLKKLQDSWDKNKDSIYKGRSKYINTAVTIEVSGSGNVVSQNQANPQIFTAIDKIKLTEK